MPELDLSTGQHYLNAWLTIPSTWTTEIMSRIGFTTLTIDMQHGFVAEKEAIDMLGILVSYSIFPIVRVPWSDPGIVMKMLDAGALGVIGPMINSKEDAERLVAWTKYPPLGERSYGPFRPNLVYGNDYYKTANERVLTIAMIETKQAVDNIRDILRVEGIGGVYIGTNDLSLSLGIKPLGDLDNEELRKSIERVIDEAKKRNILVGMHSRTTQEVSVLKEMGINIITPINDSRLLDTAVSEIFSDALKLIGD